MKIYNIYLFSLFYKFHYFRVIRKQSRYIRCLLMKALVFQDVWNYRQIMHATFLFLCVGEISTNN